MPADRPPLQLPVYEAPQFTVVEGTNLGDPLGFADELLPDDVYELSKEARPARLAVDPSDGTAFAVAQGSGVGRPGAPLHLDCCLTLMGPDGVPAEALVLVELDESGHVEAIYLHPMARLAPRVPYALVGIDRAGARRRFAEVGCVSFSRGTRITLASGAQIPIEELRAGDRVLTRDDGAQPLRWIGQSTVRAVGAFAPIVITAGALHNAADLVVSPDHRLFVWQREDRLGAGRAEVLVRARHLVNGTTVHFREGGFVDYFQLLFDRHQIIYAEGIAAESLLVDTQTRPVLPETLTKALSNRLPGHGAAPHLDFEVQERLIRRPDAVDLLRRASAR
jgi:hypothetical protein